MPKNILPPGRPKRSQADIEAILEHHKMTNDRLRLIFIRGYYLDSMGKQGANDINIYDDACFVISPTIFESFNANTDPSFVTAQNGRKLACLALGVFQFYRGLHKGKYKALRAYPEGVILPCTRDGEKSTCSAINIHKGSSNPAYRNVTFSEGCLTIPDIQYNEWQRRLWAEFDKHGQKAIDVILVENIRTGSGQTLRDAAGKII